MHNRQAREYTQLSGEINSLYHEFAVKSGVSDTVLNILYVVCEMNGKCLQSDIFKITGISRQTINSAIKKLEKDNVVILEQGTGRNTIVCLTEKGKKFAEKTVYPIFEIENKVWNEWTTDEQQQYLKLTKQFCNSFRKHINNEL